MPRWVKVSGLVALGLAVVVVTVAVLGGHGPGGRGNHFGDSQPAAEPGMCAVEPIDHAGGAGATIRCESASGPGRSNHEFSCQGANFVGLQVDRDVDEGEFSVTVKDGAGSTVFSDSYSGAGQDDANLDGTDGAWEIAVVRGDQFAGDFTVQVFCGSH